jgi:hypothetical protein
MKIGGGTGFQYLKRVFPALKQKNVCCLNKNIGAKSN